MMQNLLLPAHDENFIMTVAKAIGHERVLKDTDQVLLKTIGYDLQHDPLLLARLESEFENLWCGKTEYDRQVRERFRADAMAAINAINLHLLTTVTE
jgi:hypothetical protein